MEVRLHLESIWMHFCVLEGCLSFMDACTLLICVRQVSHALPGFAFSLRNYFSGSGVCWTFLTYVVMILGFGDGLVVCLPRHDLSLNPWLYVNHSRLPITRH